MILICILIALSLSVGIYIGHQIGSSEPEEDN
jgi:hypothetical protein